MALSGLTPKQIVEKLDAYIIGQEKAKKAVAIALRNRERRIHLAEDIRDEVAPKNILMIGPTGVGKTEIARRLAKLVNAPFLKIEATKYTEVGYVGRDVESMIRDLMAVGYTNVKAEMEESLREACKPKVEEKLLDLLLPGTGEKDKKKEKKAETPFANPVTPTLLEPTEAQNEPLNPTREKFRQMLRDGKLEDREVEVTVERVARMPSMGIIASGNMEDLQTGMEDLTQMLTGGRFKKKQVSIREARKIITEETLDSMIDQEKVAEEAKNRVEQSGIIFIDEIDKIATKGGNSSGQDVSREGVQRDILPIVEGSKVNTRYGVVDTTHILFVAAGAFSVSAPSDLIPELQGRFPLRVELESLSKADFKRILTEPKNALTKQYSALLQTEGVTLDFTDDAIDKMAAIAEDVNSRSENIGARRLHTIMEKVTEEISFDADEHAGETVKVDSAFVEEKLKDITTDQDLSRYIL
ncbi:MAG: ATP-dependent protease ATPase subunit HslU [Treponema sp.]|nr:ATP-dependent protease ATPase subunit HslU [Treponema sp.]